MDQTGGGGSGQTAGGSAQARPAQARPQRPRILHDRTVDRKQGNCLITRLTRWEWSPGCYALYRRAVPVGPIFIAAGLVPVGRRGGFFGKGKGRGNGEGWRGVRSGRS